jgi:hypothetical protein
MSSCRSNPWRQVLAQKRQVAAVGQAPARCERNLPTRRTVSPPKMQLRHPTSRRGRVGRRHGQPHNPRWLRPAIRERPPRSACPLFVEFQDSFDSSYPAGTSGLRRRDAEEAVWIRGIERQFEAGLEIGRGNGAEGDPVVGAQGGRGFHPVGAAGDGVECGF